MLEKRRFIVFFVIVLMSVITFSVAAGMSSEDAAAESAASTTGHGKYLVGQGIIIPPESVYVDSYIASVDYRYPIPEEGIGLTLYSGHRQLSNRGQSELIQVGIQGGKMNFDDLPPLNVAFVIDKSGSMGDQDKMGWVKESFYIFIENIRDNDFVSLIVFNNDAKVIYPSTRMDSREKRLRFKEAVRNITPGGGTDLREGLDIGYSQVLANYRSEYTNRVLFLTDGVGRSKGILDIAATYREMGINVSTIGLGSNFDLKLMNDLARAGGGSSRFVADREEMEKIFGSELDRAFVPVARNLEMRLELLGGVELVETWGYNHTISGKEVTYYLPTLHHGDYETILTRINIPENERRGTQELIRFTLNALDIQGNPLKTESRVLESEFVDDPMPVTGYSDAMILRSGTTLDYAESLIMIGELYYSCQAEIAETNELRDELWRSRGEGNLDEGSYTALTNPYIEELERSVNAKMKRALDLTVSTKKSIENARLRLDNEGFNDELDVLEQYIRIIGSDLEMEETKVNDFVRDREIRPTVTARLFTDHAANLFREMTLDLRTRSDGVVAVSGFTMQSGKTPQLVNMLNEMATVEFGRIDTLTLVERNKLDQVLVEQQLQLTGLVDTSTAIRVGEILAARYIVTGSVIEMTETVVIFGRVINVESGEVESVAQVIVPKDREVVGLLGS